jgi:hypothetical protein
MVTQTTNNTTVSAVLQKYWISIALFALTALGFASGPIALIAAFIFTFTVPGLCFYRFFPLESYEKWAFIPIFSVLFSVEFIYFTSLALGYSSNTILLCFLILAAIYTVITYKKGQEFKPQQLKTALRKVNKTALVLFAAVLVISLAVLLRTVWYTNADGIVLTGSNWQDTPFHYEIIESLNNGNFPPTTPNYVGVTLSYHYFVDFHTAILEKLYGYLPMLLPVLNACFITIFSLSMYALARPHGKQAAVTAAIVGTFGWGFSYFGMFQALFSGDSLASQTYVQYQGLFGLPPIYDNLLQQRPLLVGLPAFVLVLCLLRNMDSTKRLLLAGLVTGLVYQFNNVAFFCCGVAYIICLLLNVRKLKKNYFAYILPAAVALPFILWGGGSFNFNLSIEWALQFLKYPPVYYFLNLGVPFIVALLCFAKKGNWTLKLLLLALLFIPIFFVFTPNVWDMYKFYIFAWIPISALMAIYLAKSRKVLVAVLVILSVLASISVITYNVSTSYLGATTNEYNAGMWVRDNTPQDSVFLTYYDIHCPTSLIGGRLRVSSYINWPYGHGVPVWQIFQRQTAIDNAYNGTEDQLKTLVQTYNVSYVYVGSEELNNYPNCIAHFNSINWLTQVYAQNSQYVYQVEWTKLDG